MSFMNKKNYVLLDQLPGHIVAAAAMDPETGGDEREQCIDHLLARLNCLSDAQQARMLNTRADDGTTTFALLLLLERKEYVMDHLPALPSQTQAILLGHLFAP